MGWVLRSSHPWVPGVNCEVNPDDCASDPCIHGVCQDGIDRYDCVCQPGFTGGCPRVMGALGAHGVLPGVLGGPRCLLGAPNGCLFWVPLLGDSVGVPMLDSRADYR